MKKILLLPLLLASLLLSAPSVVALEGPCREMGVRRTITCAARRWPVPGGPPRARAVAWCESRYNPNAVNGRFRGVYQIGDREWRDWLARFPTMRARWVSHILHGRSNVLVAVRTAHRLGSWYPWSC